MSAAEQWREDWHERRPTPSQRLHEVTMAALTRPHAEPESSVEISRNAKGDFQFTVTVRGASADACEQVALMIIGDLRREFPHSSELNGGE
jgi:hypothetical protein